MSINSFVCPICENTDIHSIGYLNGKPYCRKCISFKNEIVGPLVRQISWTSNAIILKRTKSIEEKEFYIILYNNHESSFDEKILKWSWDINDKRKVKRMKKYKKYFGNKKSR